MQQMELPLVKKGIPTFRRTFGRVLHDLGVPQFTKPPKMVKVKHKHGRTTKDVEYGDDSLRWQKENTLKCSTNMQLSCKSILFQNHVTFYLTGFKAHGRHSLSFLVGDWPCKTSAQTQRSNERGGQKNGSQESSWVVKLAELRTPIYVFLIF